LRKKGSGTDDQTMIKYTLSEIHRLLLHLIFATRPAEHVWSWSRWRRRRKHQARTGH
jgi:hypothetical protein